MLKNHPALSADVRERVVAKAGHIGVIDEDPARIGFEYSDDMLECHGLSHSAFS